jgi:predicted nucleic acid-binding Zn ribbon protein
MRCPECHTETEPDSAACGNCGLLLIAVQPKHRRAEDFAVQKRRASDRDSDLALDAAACPFCAGAIPSNAIRCMHCSEIVNQDYYRERAQRIRARINYASWVAYLFGLLALIVFRPVGLVSIGTGLLLSIAYYAIPVEPPAPRGARRGKFTAFLRRQMKFERVAISIPAFKNKKLIFVGTPLIAALVGYSANLFLLQEPVNDILHRNSAFAGMEVSAHYEYWVVPGVVVYDLQKLSFRQTPIDVHTAFLEFAKKLRTRRYSRVNLSYHGITKFSIDGNGFRKLGDEYAKRNFDFVLYSFPRLFHPEDHVHGPEPGTSDRDALLVFHRQWYGEDGMTKPLGHR